MDAFQDKEAVNIEVECPCGTIFMISSRYAGKKGKCPICGGIVRVSDLANPEPIDADEALSERTVVEEDESEAAEVSMVGSQEPILEPLTEDLSRPKHLRPAKRQDSYLAGWMRVDSGLGLLYKALAAVIILSLMRQFLGFLASNISREDFKGLNIALSVIGLGAIVGMILGKARCLYVPAKTGLRKFIVGSMLCPALAIVVSIFFVATMKKRPPSIPKVVLMVASSYGLIIAGEVMFLLFLRGVGVFLKSKLFKSTVTKFIIYVAVMMVAMPTLAVGMAILSASSKSPAPFLAATIVLLVLQVILLFWYFRILTGARDLIRRHARKM